MFLLCETYRLREHVEDPSKDPILIFPEGITAHYTYIDLSPFEWNFDLDKSGQKFHHSLKEHHKISNIPKFRCEML